MLEGLLRKDVMLIGMPCRASLGALAHLLRVYEMRDLWIETVKKPSRVGACRRAAGWEYRCRYMLYYYSIYYLPKYLR